MRTIPLFGIPVKSWYYCKWRRIIHGASPSHNNPSVWLKSPNSSQAVVFFYFGCQLKMLKMNCRNTPLVPNDINSLLFRAKHLIWRDVQVLQVLYTFGVFFPHGQNQKWTPRQRNYPPGKGYISHQGKMIIILKNALGKGYVSSQEDI